MPLYDYGAPSSVNAWVDHMIVPGRAFDSATATQFLGNRQFLVIAVRGGGYGPGTPKKGWEHATPGLAHGLYPTGLVPTVIDVEPTLAESVPALQELIPLAQESLRSAQQTIDALWSREPSVP